MAVALCGGTIAQTMKRGHAKTAQREKRTPAFYILCRSALKSVFSGVYIYANEKRTNARELTLETFPHTWYIRTNVTYMRERVTRWGGVFPSHNQQNRPMENSKNYTIFRTRCRRVQFIWATDELL